MAAVRDSQLKANINNDKVVMMNGDTALSKQDSLTTECITVTSNQVEGSTMINVNKLADEPGYLVAVKPGETITLTFKVKVGKLLPGETN